MPDRYFLPLVALMLVLSAIAVVIGGSVGYVLASASLLVWFAALLLDYSWMERKEK